MLSLPVKAFALFFLLQAISVFIAAFSAERLAPLVDVRYRARFVSASLLFAFILPLVYAVAVAIMARAGLFSMETSYFHVLMHGGWEISILLAGTLGFALSVLSSFLFVKFGSLSVKSGRGSYKEFRGVRILESEKINGAALLGAFWPVIVLGSAFQNSEWSSIILVHEHSHFVLKHNLHKLFMRALLRLNMFNLPLHRLVARFDLMCEMEADAESAAQAGVERYSRFLSDLAAVSETAEDIESRLAELGCIKQSPAGNRNLLSPGVTLAAAVIIAAAPLAALAALAVPRCAMVCFLGF